MPKQHKRTLWLIVLMVVTTAGALALVVARTKGKSDPAVTTSGAPPPSTSGATVQGQVSRRNDSSRNLSLQPEAFKLSLKLGQRFKGSRSDVTVLAGTLSRGGERQAIQIVRRQAERGERVEIATGVGAASLTWSETEGAKGSGGTPNNLERLLVERLALDSVDQFILAQLRGASYYTVARNVRPDEAGDSDNYNGPLWDIIRVSEPEQDEQKRPLSRWRLYYINSTTGLIDKIVSEINGERIEAGFSAWTEQGGEKFPSQITWTHQGQEVMALRLTNVSHGPQK